MTGARGGRVVDAAGAPVPDALVSVVASSVPVPELALLTDADGRFELRLPAGKFQVEARTPHGSGRVTTQGGDGDELVIRVAP